MLSMAWAERQSLVGIWWLPETPEDELHGTLEIIPGETSTLELIGAFKGLNAYDAVSFVEKARIFGVVSGKIVTLVNCHVGGGGLSFPGFEKTKIYADAVLFGAHADSFAISKVSFQGEGLEEWLGRGGIQIANTEFATRTFSIAYRQPATEAFFIDEATSLEIDFPTREFPAWDSERTSFAISQAPRLTLKFTTPVQLRVVDTYLFRLWLFVRLAYDQPLQLFDITLQSPEVTLSRGEETSPVALTYLKHPGPKAEHKFDARRHLIPFKFICANRNAFQRWFELYEVVDAAFDLHFSVDHQDGFYIEQEFLARTSCLEVMHRRIVPPSPSDQDLHARRLTAIYEKLSDSEHLKWVKEKLIFSHEPTLRQRLGGIANEVVDILGGKDFIADKFLGQVANTRNHLTHYNKKSRKKILDANEKVAALVKLRSMFVVYVLLQLGFDKADIRQLVESPFGIKYQLRRIQET